MFTKKRVSGGYPQGISIAYEYPYPNPIPNPIQGILGALRAEIDFSTNLKDKMQSMIGISYSNSNQS
jgi:hypothetical protein